MKTSTLAISTCAAVALFAGTAFADDTAAAPGSTATVKSTEEGHGRHGHMACRADVKKLCADVRIGDGLKGIKACLDSHASELSSGCSERIATLKAKKAEFDAACGHDVDNFCAAVKANTDDDVIERIHGVMSCLREHKADLSETCKTFRAAQKGERGNWREHGEKAE